MLDWFERKLESLRYECLKKTYNNLLRNPSKYEEICGRRYANYFKNFKVIVGMASQDSRIDTENMKTFKRASVFCGIDDCGCSADVIHKRGQMKKGSAYTLQAIPQLTSNGFLELHACEPCDEMDESASQPHHKAVQTL